MRYTSFLESGVTSATRDEIFEFAPGQHITVRFVMFRLAGGRFLVRNEQGRKGAENRTGRLHEDIVEVPVSTWDEMLGQLQQADRSDHHQDRANRRLG